MEIRWGGETIHLLPGGALSWPRGRTLFVADAHFGKGEAFRAAGIPIPPGTTEEDGLRLTGLVEESGSHRLVILGDFLHAPASRRDTILDALESWRLGLEGKEVLLIRGNHDRISHDPPERLGVRVAEGPFPLGPFSLRHEPSRGEPEGLELAGHLHPSVLLQGTGGDRLRVPCFWFSRNRVVLPAFGGFTGSARVRPGPGDRIFVVGPEDVMEVPLGSPRGVARPPP